MDPKFFGKFRLLKIYGTWYGIYGDGTEVHR